MTAFLGFTHALSRLVSQRLPGLGNIIFSRCALVCHTHQVHCQRDQYGQGVFALTRNPLDDKGATLPFQEEGRMHFTVSLILDCALSEVDLAKIGLDAEAFQQKIYEWVLGMRLAGGSIQGLESVRWIEAQQLSEPRDVKQKILFNYCLALL
jgi:CRISPR-associated protein Csy2